ncbi:MAG TPA: glycosyltransferase [Methylomirabilota bacterium]|jgi:cellulose synthase/poly-beta-1,6-N-acetylglucosamine synthase-like glycosyltransferase|nr:glycosyltransferase [Methylomirabilota bacterium]
MAQLPNHLVWVVAFCALVDFVKLLVELLGRAEDRRFQSDPSQVTAVIASRNGADLLAGTIDELAKLIPPERILVVDDGSTDGTAEIARAKGCVVHRFSRSKGKASAINYAVYRVPTPFTLLLDDDTRIGNARLPTALLAESACDAVAFHVLPDRRSRNGSRGNNFIGKLQRYEYGKSMEIGKRFHDVSQSVSCISGAAGLFRTADLNDLHHEHSTVFQGEDLQRTIIHLLHGRRIVFANEPVWTVAPGNWRAWFVQRLVGWYPGFIHQLPNMVRLLIAPGHGIRLRYEMAYNIYTVLFDWLKVASLAVLALTPGLRWWLLVIYLLYLAFELYSWWVVRIPGTRTRAPLGVLLVYPIYGALNTVLRTLSLVVWVYLRFVSGVMRPRRTAEDRVPA